MAIVDYRDIGLFRLAVLALLASFAAQFVHEAGHCAAYSLMGLDPVWSFASLVQLWDEAPLNPGNWSAFSAPDGASGWLRLSSAPDTAELAASSLAGPLASILGMALGLYLLRRGGKPATRRLGAALTLATNLPMVLYYLRSPWRGAGDEYFIAAYAGIPEDLLNALFGLAFLAGLIIALRSLGDRKTRLRWLGGAALGLIPSGAFVMFANSWVIARVNGEHPLFKPALGFALPVLLFNTAVLASLCLWRWRSNERPDRKAALGGTDATPGARRRPR